MGLVGFLTGKGVGQEALPPVKAAENGSGDSSSAVDDLAKPAFQPPNAGPLPGPAPKPHSSVIESPITPGQSPAPVAEPADSEAAVEAPLDAPLRDLFTESSTTDPQLEALLKLVEPVDASELALELKEIANELGAAFGEDRLGVEGDRVPDSVPSR